MALNEKQLRTALRTARVPSEYQRREVSLTNYGDNGKAVQQWLADGLARQFAAAPIVIEINGLRDHASPIFHCLSRALLMHSVATYYMHAHEWLHSYDAHSEDITACNVLFVEGIVAEPAPFSPSEAFKLRWLVTRWINSGRSLVMLNDHPIEGCGYFNPMFKHVVTEKLAMRI